MKISVICAGLVGLIVGAATTWLIAGHVTGKVFAMQYLTGVRDQVNVASHIRAERHAVLLTNIEARLPEYVLTVDEEWRSYPGATNTLWAIKAYYERSNLPVPSEIRGIFDALPPKPLAECRISSGALDATNESTGLSK